MTSPTPSPISDQAAGEPVAYTLRHRMLLTKLQVGGCTCLTKTPEIQWHAEDCQYRLATEIDDMLATFSTAPTTGSAPVALQALHDRFSNMPRHKSYISGQQYSFLALDDVLGYVENAMNDDAPPSNAPVASGLDDSDIDALALRHCYELVEGKLRFSRNQWRAFARAVLAASMGGDKS